MGQYVSWSLSTDELMLDTIWKKSEEFCKPQSNEVRASFDLLTCFQQGNRSVDERYNAVQTQVALAKYPPGIAKILHRDIFWFFLKDEEFVSKTINDSNMDLDTFPASKVWQLAKKMESSKATARHIKQVANDLHTAKLILCDTSAQISQQANTRRGDLLLSLDHPVARMMQVTDDHYLCTTTTPTRKFLCQACLQE